MADTILSAFDGLDLVANDDELYIVDVSDTTDDDNGSSKKIAFSALVGSSTITMTNKTLTSPVLNTGVSGTAFLDEDNMASNSATKVASQQSIKAYVDSGTVTLTNKTLTTPTFADGGTIVDPAGNEFLQFAQVSSAVNEFRIYNAATGNAPNLMVVGDDTDIDLVLTPKGTGRVKAATVNIPSISSTDTLTNKRITKRVGTTTSSATPTINTDNVDMYIITAQAEDITSFTTNLSGTPANGDTLWIAITGTAARAIAWGAKFEASTVSLPTTTVTTNRLDAGFVWNAVTEKWRCIATG